MAVIFFHLYHNKTSQIPINDFTGMLSILMQSVPKRKTKSHQIHPRWFTTGYEFSPYQSLAFAPSSVMHSSDIHNFTSSNNPGLLLLHSSVGLHPSFSGHGIIKASFILLIWLNENDPLRGTFSRHGITQRVREERLPSPTGLAVSRRVFDSFSSESRSSFVRLSFGFCLILVRSSFGLR